MGKLTARQEQNIVSAYAAGGVSQTDLAVKYGVNNATISRIIKRNAEFAEKCKEIKKEQEEEDAETMREYFKSRRGKAQSLLDALLNIPQDLIDKTSVRDRVGAAHYIKEMFLEGKDEEITEDGDERIEVVIVNNGKPSD